MAAAAAAAWMEQDRRRRRVVTRRDGGAEVVLRMLFVLVFRQCSDCDVVSYVSLFMLKMWRKILRFYHIKNASNLPILKTLVIRS